MRALSCLATFAVVLAFLPLAAQAQTVPAFDRPFRYTDRDGTGTLSIRPVFEVSTGLGFQRIQVTLDQANRRFSGAGAYYLLNQNPGVLSPPILLAFTLQDASGREFFFEGSLPGSTGALSGQGTYFPLTSPRTVIAWRIQSQSGVPGSIESSRPTLRQGWQQASFAEAIGGVYYSTFNRVQGVESTATWSGSLPASGRYRVEVFIPRQPQASTPRTGRAQYRITGAGPQSQDLPRIDQNVATSRWVELGTFNFGTSYEIVLTDETGEPSFSRSVVANAIRLTPVPGTP